MTRCLHCKRFVPEFPGTTILDPYPVSHACVLLRASNGRVYGAVPFVASLYESDRKNAARAEWDLSFWFERCCSCGQERAPDPRSDSGMCKECYDS